MLGSAVGSWLRCSTVLRSTISVDSDTAVLEIDGNGSASRSQSLGAGSAISELPWHLPASIKTLSNAVTGLRDNQLQLPSSAALSCAACALAPPAQNMGAGPMYVRIAGIGVDHSERPNACP